MMASGASSPPAKKSKTEAKAAAFNSRWLRPVQRVSATSTTTQLNGPCRRPDSTSMRTSTTSVAQLPCKSPLPLVSHQRPQTCRWICSPCIACGTGSHSLMQSLCYHPRQRHPPLRRWVCLSPMSETWTRALLARGRGIRRSSSGWWWTIKPWVQARAFYD